MLLPSSLFSAFDVKINEDSSLLSTMHLIFSCQPSFTVLSDGPQTPIPKMKQSYRHINEIASAGPMLQDDPIVNLSPRHHFCISILIIPSTQSNFNCFSINRTLTAFKHLDSSSFIPFLIDSQSLTSFVNFASYFSWLIFNFYTSFSCIAFNCF